MVERISLLHDPTKVCETTYCGECIRNNEGCIKPEKKSIYEANLKK